MNTDEDVESEDDEEDVESEDDVGAGIKDNNDLEDGEINEDDEEDGEEDGDEDGEEDGEEDGDVKLNTDVKKTKQIPTNQLYNNQLDDDDDDDDEDGELYLQKFDQDINENYVVDFHPESVLQNYDEVLSMLNVVRDIHGIIVDDLHKTIPYLTKYEKARILGQRAKQINSGAAPFVKVPENVIDGYIIAELELKQKQIPFIIRRPMPSGGSEYWSIKDLEDISF